MKEILILILIVLAIYSYQQSVKNEEKIFLLEREITEIQYKYIELKKELSGYKVRQVNWFSQLEEQSEGNDEYDIK